MSFYGATSNPTYSIHKRRLQANGEFRFGGANVLLAYRVPESTEGSVEVPVQESSTGNGTVHIVQTGTTECVSVAIRGSNDKVVIQAPQFVDVKDEYKVAPQTHVVVLEGSFTAPDNKVYDANTIVPVVVTGNFELPLSGSGKILTFTVAA